MAEANRQDVDPNETQEWLDALDSLVQREGLDRANYVIKHLNKAARAHGVSVPDTDDENLPYVNTIPVDEQLQYPGDREIEREIGHIMRWNAACMVLKATHLASELGGHISTYASSSVLYSVGFNHFFKADDLVFFQGHASPGMYSRAYLEGRLTESQISHFRQEVAHKDGISSYPHPWLMPDFWQFPTVSMGLGPLQAIYQARFLKYLENRGLQKTDARHVWAFCGDGEMDEIDSMGAIHIARKEQLDNLIFVINCNLQRLDGPVRGNSSIVRELESQFLGAGWNVIKVLWGSGWDKLFEKDKSGLLIKRMAECVDGDYQNYRAKDGVYIREHFFGKYPELKALVADMSDEEIWNLRRGGHDVEKVYAAYHRAVNTKNGRPTVLLTKTVKGFGLGISAGEGQNVAHNTKKMTLEQIQAFQKANDIPVEVKDLDNVPFYRPAEDSPVIQYIKKSREALGGYVPARREKSESLKVPALEAFKNQLEATGDREISSTMAFVRILNTILKDKNIGERVVTIVPDESRTFGMEGMFRQYGIYSPVGQLYEPVDKHQVMYYKESKTGQVFEEGLNEAGAMCSWMAAGSSYSVNNLPMIPFYIYYSMFGFQRTGDLAYAAGDMQCRGFLIGATSGRTTLAGEGLQHQDGHNHIIAHTIPNCVSYDPTFSYELTVIIQDGLRRMYQEQESVFYYVTVMNENYEHPEMPKGVEEGIRKGLYLFKKAKAKAKHTVQLMGCGSILTEVIAAADILEKDFEVSADIWSATSFNELAREGLDVVRWNHLHPDKKPRESYVESCLKDHKGPVVAASDYLKLYAEQIRQFVPQPYYVLGTDGFGRSDTRKQLRKHFEVNRYYVAYYALKALADAGEVDKRVVKKAMKTFEIDPEKINPLYA